MAVPPAPRRLPLVRLTGLAVSVALIGLSLVWSFLGMRAILDIGGACASGGPYVPVQPCPAGANALLGAAIPLLLLATVVASGVAVTLNAPTLLLPMWILLFGSHGWSFLEYAVAGDGVVLGWLIPGILFELMALPALVLWIGIRHVTDVGLRPRAAGFRWWLLYAAAGASGAILGLRSFDAWT